MKKTLLSILIALCVSNAYAERGSTEGSEISPLIMLSGVVINFPSKVIKNAGEFLQAQTGLLVQRVSNAGQHSVLAIGNASGALVASVTVAAGSVGAASMLVGQGVRVVVETSGHALYAGSRLIAFIPNELAKSLVYHEKIKG